MGVVKKALKYTVGLAIAGFAAYELARMYHRKGSELQTRMERTETGSRDPRDYRSIYGL